MPPTTTPRYTLTLKTSPPALHFGANAKDDVSVLNNKINVIDFHALALTLDGGSQDSLEE